MAPCIQPLFLLSLPRSGSTLLQAHLSASPEIRSAPEPWVVLPFLTATDGRAAIATHNHQHAAAAIDEFAPRRRWNEAVRRAVLDLYSASALPTERYFLDKTPRYAPHAKRLREIFPEAKFIILWRDPRHVLSSIIRTWGSGHWSVPLYAIDLHESIHALAEFASEPDTFETRYEDFVTDPAGALARMSTYLDIRPETGGNVDTRALQAVVGTMGDRSGVERLGAVPRGQFTDAWAREFLGPLRRRWLRNYLAALPDHVHRLYPDLDHRLPTGMRARPVDRGSDIITVPATSLFRSLNTATHGFADYAVRSLYSKLRDLR